MWEYERDVKCGDMRGCDMWGYEGDVKCGDMRGM